MERTTVARRFKNLKRNPLVNVTSSACLWKLRVSGFGSAGGAVAGDVVVVGDG